MKDLINRQDAIDTLEEHLDYLQKLNKDENPKAESEWYGVNWARNTIADLPSAQPEVLTCGNGELDAQSEQRWIPCSERLPEEDGEYLVESTRGYEVLYYREEEKQFGLMVFNFAGKVGFVPKKVYEWMPIPGVEE